eukprot:TRINITY_DN26183_c0_g1_i2.p3 TRINITY_DN26183_c0_g1~~TRINITY_DN26183_c0_g1_i2.p3  ORF type:complete len:121 (-),score=51.91 TRINITY_DN26183_c0_g1_i2:332-694(-)
MIKEITSENMITWLRKQGVKMPSIGTIAELDEIAVRFLKEGMKDDDLAAARQLAETEYKNDKKAPIYVKTMEKVKSKGEDYIKTEIARVEAILNGKLTPEKKAELSEKIKVLNVFASKDA